MKQSVWVFLFLLLSACSTAERSSPDEVEIIEVQPSPKTARAKAGLAKMLERHDVSVFLYTKKIQIQENVISHSSPVLTLNAKYASQPETLLSILLHEEMHWFLMEHQAAIDAAVLELKSRYPKLPTGERLIARDEYSTYLHLVVCWLELQLDRQFFGDEKARAIIEGFEHYRWIYKTVLADEDSIGKIVIFGKLIPPGLTLSNNRRD